jgi:hypothetical protein
LCESSVGKPSQKRYAWINLPPDNNFILILDLEKHSKELLSPPHSIGSVLTSVYLLSPATDIKVKHGVIGLLKHLAQASTQSATINTALRSAGVVRRISESGIWDEKADAMAEIVQLGAIGVVKHLCSADGNLGLTHA